MYGLYVLLVIYGLYYLYAKNTLKKRNNLSCTTTQQSHSIDSISKSHRRNNSTDCGDLNSLFYSSDERKNGVGWFM